MNVNETSESTPAGRRIRAWRAANEAGDSRAAIDCLAADVQFISPLTAQFRFRGRDQVGEVLAAAFEVLSDVRYHTEVGDEATRALVCTGRCGKEQFEEAQLLRLDPDGLIVELTFFGRPLPGVTAVMAAIGPLLVRRQGRPALSRIIAAATKPLAAMTRIGDAHLVPRADPARTEARKVRCT